MGQKTYIAGDDITKLPFMTSVIKETLRMYPPVPNIARDILKPMEVDGMVFPQDSTVIVCHSHPLFNFRLKLNICSTDQIQCVSHTMFAYFNCNRRVQSPDKCMIDHT